MKKQLRTCQECGHKQHTRVPPEDRSGADYAKWAELLCKKCRSPGLDFGNTVEVPENG